MPGAYVFPGGRLEREDLSPRLWARCEGLDTAIAAHRLGEEDGRQAMGLHVAAARETFEEAGVWLGGPVTWAEGLAGSWEALRSGRCSFAELLEASGARLRLDALQPLARWVTPPQELRRYDARFFLARMPAGQRARHDGLETTDGRWIGAEAALRACEQGQMWLAPPTLRTLEWLSRFRSTEEVFAAARARRVPLVEPVALRLPSGERAVVLPGDPLHPIVHPVIEGPTRFVFRAGRFRSEPA